MLSACMSMTACVSSRARACVYVCAFVCLCLSHRFGDGCLLLSRARPRQLRPLQPFIYNHVQVTHLRAHVRAHTKVHHAFLHAKHNV